VTTSHTLIISGPIEELEPHLQMLTAGERHVRLVDVTAGSMLLEADLTAPTVEADDRVCRVCGCTDYTACGGMLGCSWVEDDLCSACVADDVARTVTRDGVVTTTASTCCDVELTRYAGPGRERGRMCTVCEAEYPDPICGADVLGFTCTLAPGHDGSHISSGTTELDDGPVDHVVIAPAVDPGTEIVTGDEDVEGVGDAGVGDDPGGVSGAAFTSPASSTTTDPESDIGGKDFTPDVTPPADGVDDTEEPSERGGSQVLPEPPLDASYPLTERVVALLEADRDIEWAPHQVATALAVSPRKVKSVGQTMSNLVTRGRIARVGIGMYQAHEAPDEAEPAESDDGDQDEDSVDERPLADVVLETMRTRDADHVWDFDDLHELTPGTNAALMAALDRLKSNLQVVKVERGRYQLRGDA
jgi:hypothetical protein